MMMTKLASRLNRLSELTGSVIAWLTLPMVGGTFVVVVLRYAFDLGWIWMQESVVWLHAVVFMLAAAYTLGRDEHVRVDIFYRGMTAQRKAWVDLLGTIAFLLPVSVFLIATSWEYVTVSWQIREGSREAGGLPYPFVPLLKSTIPLAFALVILQGLADAISNVVTLSSRYSAEADTKSDSHRRSES
jgi:TRAP-type mannitol/chloroaromatic compound transport system permease small subunit